MSKLIEYTLVSVDGVFENPAGLGFLGFRDEAYVREGLGVLSACEAMLMGRHTYEALARIWPVSDHPWAERLNTMPKYVFTSGLEHAEWQNTTIVTGDLVATVSELKAQASGDLVIWGHTRVARALMVAKLVDTLDLSIHPVVAGRGGLLFEDGLSAELELTSVKTFSKIVKLSYAIK